MNVYLHAKFEVFSIILTGFRLLGFREEIWPPSPPLTSKGTPKKPTQFRVKCQILLQPLLQYLYRYFMFLHEVVNIEHLHEQWSCLYLYNKAFYFHHISVFNSHTKIHTLQFNSNLIFINLNKQAYSLSLCSLMVWF